MEIYLAATGNARYAVQGVNRQIPYVLESFWYVKEWQWEYIKGCRRFMMDSGAFTFMEHTKSGVDFNEYVRRYAESVVDHDVELFFEVDIDALVGHKETLRLTDKLEAAAGRQCIPVWHTNRGIPEFERLCRDYSYVAFGGIVSGEVPKKHHHYFSWFAATAHKYGAKIHGLGITPLKEKHSLVFDSADSKSWKAGSFGNVVYQFKNGNLLTSQKKNHRRLHYKPMDIHNLEQWILYAEYMDRQYV